MCRIDRNGYTYEVHSRDLSGMITHATLPLSAGQISHTIDVMGRRTSVHHLAFSEERTVFDSIGCCLERTIDGRREVFSYDFLCQLTSDNGKSSAYDSLHRRLETKGLRATHNARHQLLSQGKKSFQYDVDGRRTHDNRYAYSYDACDRLITIEDDNTKYEYTYDSFNRRMSSQILNKSTSIETQERYLWQGECEIGSVDSDSSMKTLRVLGEGLGGELGAAVAYELDGNIIIPIHDLSGHVRACINTHGDTVETLNYTAFGLESRSSDITPWTFSSKRHVNGTDFLYFGRRFYDPETATWLTQDPVGQSAGPNLYAYVKNNPLTCFDLYGLIDGSNESQGEYVMCERGVWRKDQVGQDNVPHLELTKNTWDEVIDKYANSKFTALGHTNGMLTTCETVRERQECAAEAYKDKYNDALAMYNPTHGLLDDLFETLCCILGIPTEVVSTLKGELMYVNDRMSEHGIQLVVDHNGFSEGAAINENILSSREFSNKGTYNESVGKAGTFGGATIDIINAENYVVKWDVVPFLNPMNWDKFFSDKVHFIDSGQNTFNAHSFDGPGYQNALDYQIHVGD